MSIQIKAEVEAKPIFFTLPELLQPLRRHEVLQTIRSRTELERWGYKVGDTVRVMHSNQFLGQANITDIIPTTLGELTEDDAKLGGLALDALKGHLRIFFRFVNDFEEHTIFKIRLEYRARALRACSRISVPCLPLSNI